MLIRPLVNFRSFEDITKAGVIVHIGVALYARRTDIEVELAVLKFYSSNL